MTPLFNLCHLTSLPLIILPSFHFSPLTASHNPLHNDQGVCRGHVPSVCTAALHLTPITSLNCVRTSALTPLSIVSPEQGVMPDTWVWHSQTALMCWLNGHSTQMMHLVCVLITTPEASLALHRNCAPYRLANLLLLGKYLPVLVFCFLGWLVGSCSFYSITNVSNSYTLQESNSMHWLSCFALLESHWVAQASLRLPILPQFPEC